MTDHDDRLLAAELLCARMAHEFSGGAGVVANLLEIAAEQGRDAGEPLALAQDAAGQLVRRLKLLRAAWGPSAEPMDRESVRALTEGLGRPNCTVNLDGLAPETRLHPETGRMLLNLLLLAAEALPAGGEIGVSGDADDLVVALAGPRAAWPQGLPACLADPAEAWRALHVPRRLQLGLVALLAPRLGCRISLLMTPGAPGGALPLRLSRL